MSFTRRLAAGAVALTLGTGSLLGIAVGQAPNAVAASHTTCKLKHGHNYPAGKCFVAFKKGTYHRKQKVKFATGRDFVNGKRVHVSLACRGVHKGVGTVTARPSGVARGSFKLPKKTKKGRCTVTAHGGKSTVKGSFKAKH